MTYNVSSGTLSLYTTTTIMVFHHWKFHRIRRISFTRYTDTVQVSWKIVSYFVANLLKTSTSFYQNQTRFIHDLTKTFGLFFGTQCK